MGNAIMILVKAGTRCQLFFCVGFSVCSAVFTMQFTYLLAFGGGCVRVPAAICLELICRQNTNNLKMGQILEK